MNELDKYTRITKELPSIDARLRNEIAAFNNDRLGDANSRFLSIDLPGVASLVAHILWSDMFVRYLFVTEIRRHKGLGKLLLTAAEAEARKENCMAIWFDTYNPEMASLGKKVGYRVAAELGDPVRSLLIKDLASPTG